MARRSDHTRAELRDLALRSAREIVREDGITALSTRRLAERIGYTSGTIYQVFRNRDDLIEQMNSETLELLFQHCRSALQKKSVKSRLRHLARQFISFANENPKEWDAIINHPFATDHPSSDVYLEKIEQLMALLRDAISDLYGEAQRERRLRDAQLLWNSLYGVFALAVAGRLSSDRSIDVAVDDLIDLYLAARA
jgi:AcrR family transcriptional regulator